MMQRSRLAAIVVSLIVLNLWRWWPADASAKLAAEARHAPMRAQDLRLAVRASTDEGLTKMERNIFQLRRLSPSPRAKRGHTPVPRPAPAVRSVPRPAPAVRSVAQPQPQEPPPKTPEQVETEAAQAELGQIKLVGVIFRDAKPHAYFARGDQTYMVSVGDKVARFTVTAITAESAKLHDPRTQTGSLIPVLGK